MTINTNMQTFTSGVLITTKPKKSRCSFYEVMKRVVNAIFVPQPVTKPLDQPAQLDNTVRAKKLLDKALQSKGIRALYKEACDTPTRYHASGEPWNVIFKSNQFGGKCDISRREIEIDPKFSDDRALSILIFELLNALQTPKMREFQELARNNLIGRDDYAYNIECLEHETECYHRKILKVVIKEMGWDEERFPIREESSLKDYLDAVEESGHTEAYRRHWDAIRREAEGT